MLTIEKVKLYCKIDSNVENTLLQDFIAASLSHIGLYCNRLFFETVQDFQAAENDLSEREKEKAIIIESLNFKQQENIELARLKLIVDWYEYRGNVTEYSIEELPHGLKALLQPYFVYNLVAD